MILSSRISVSAVMAADRCMGTVDGCNIPPLKKTEAFSSNVTLPRKKRYIGLAQTQRFTGYVMI
jgi:hypothetical protein